MKLKFDNETLIRYLSLKFIINMWRFIKIPNFIFTSYGDKDKIYIVSMYIKFDDKLKFSYLLWFLEPVGYYKFDI